MRLQGYGREVLATRSLEYGVLGLTLIAVETLKGQVRLQTSALLSTETTQGIITSGTSQLLKERLEKQKAYQQQCIYRTCAGITAFRVRDPDPNAVDGGNVLGIKIEVMTRAKFLRPYYVFLTRPYTGSEQRTRFLRVHRHTVPPCIPLNGLAARYLPVPRSEGGVPTAQRQQDLARFTRMLRREMVRYHNRVAVIAELRKAVGLDGKKKDAANLAENSSILAISAADTEAKQVRIDWKDGRSGRLVVNDDGEVIKLVILGERGRERNLTRELLSSGPRLEDVARKLAAI